MSIMVGDGVSAMLNIDCLLLIELIENMTDHFCFTSL
jgi:hypothetical protein